MGIAKKAVQLFAQALQLDHHCPHARTKRGICLVKIGKLEEAMAEFDIALEDDPHDDDAFKAKSALISGQGEQGKAQDPKLQAAEKQNEAEVAIQEGKYAEAVALFTAALEFDSSAGHAQASRATCLMKLGRPAEARPDFDAALQADSNNLLALLGRAELKLSEGDYDGAIADYNAKLQLAPGDGQSLYNRATAKLKKGEKDSAVQDLVLAKRLGFSEARNLLKSISSK